MYLVVVLVVLVVVAVKVEAEILWSLRNQPVDLCSVFESDTNWRMNQAELCLFLQLNHILALYKFTLSQVNNSGQIL